ncbi:MAG: aminoglycoside 6-adenylyltransferase [Defluviitaleaceae bacterium]|nr:aminoglycoside 6-adenylyltransferase [Defluviitaleaceae bacterium]
MRSEKEMFELILHAAQADERIRGVLLAGSRADVSVPKDKYQDYDVEFYVTDIKTFYNNPDWVINQFGKPLIMQMPEAMRGATGNGHFNYQMIFPDGNRIDLSFVYKKYMDNGSPAIVLLDKDNGNGFFPPIHINPKHWHITPPTPQDYYSCTNNFWWCLNNVAKGIKRDELPYVKEVLDGWVRGTLHEMIDWYIGTQHGFDLSTGKCSKFIKKYLSPELYTRYVNTYSAGDYDDIWRAITIMCDLFHDLAVTVANHFNFIYRQDEEDGIRAYLRMTKE